MAGIEPGGGDVIDDGGGGDGPMPDPPPTVSVDLIVSLFDNRPLGRAAVGSVVAALTSSGMTTCGIEQGKHFLTIPNVTMTRTRARSLFEHDDQGDVIAYNGSVNLESLLASAAGSSGGAMMGNLLDPSSYSQPFLEGNCSVPADVLDHLTISQGQIEP